MKKRNLFRWHVFLSLFFICTAFAHAQTVKITGNITSAKDGLPIVGVTIVEKGTTNGTISDEEGFFSMNAERSGILQVSFIGFVKQEIPINRKNYFDIALQEDSEILSEVIVTGYMTQRKADLTGAVAIVDLKDVRDMPGGNIMKDLQGRVPGLFITSDGSPRNAVTVRIRGLSTFGDNDPLYIIDGVPTKAAMHELNDNDIESIQVLKDASSASIYGSRASNGVILITTRKGTKTGKPRVEYNGLLTMQKFVTKREMLNTQQWGEAFWRASINDGLSPAHQQYTFDWHTDTSGRNILDRVNLPEFIDDKKTMRPGDTDWFDEITRTGFAQQHNITVSTGNDRSNSLFSLGYLGNNGIIRTTKLDKYSLRFNSEYQLIDKVLKIGENFAISYLAERTDPGVMGLALIQHPLVPVHTIDGVGWGGPATGMGDRHNPVRLLEDTKQNKEHFMRSFGNVYVDLQPIKNLLLRTNFGIDYGNWYMRGMDKKYVSGYLESSKNSTKQEQKHNINWTWSNTANYNFSIKKNNFDVLAGVEYLRSYSENVWGSREMFTLEDTDYMYLDAGTANKNNGGNGSENTMMSYFGKINYSYGSKYLASATIRRDGSSKFGLNNRFGTFPAFSLGWRLSEEEFFANNVKFFSDLKLRYGWGKTGNQDILSNDATYNVYIAGYDKSSYDLSGSKSGNLPSGYYRTKRGNPNLRWEETKQSNYGIDFAFLNNKITGSFDYFNKNTTGILIFPPNVATGGEGYDYWVNGASMNNKGFEAVLSYMGETGNKLKYSITGNISSYKNKVTYLPDAVKNAYGGNGFDQTILGRSKDMSFGYIADGIFKTQEEVDAHAKQQGKAVGRIKYKDINGDGEITDRYDRTWIGNPHPDFIYGLNTSLAHKNFDINIFFQGVVGVDVYNDNKKMTDFWFFESGNNKGIRVLDAWSPDNPDSTIPALSLTDKNNEGRTSTYFVESGAYLKLRSVSLGYSLPKPFINKYKMESVRLFVQGLNLLTIAKSWGDNKFTGVDPENVGNGYPNPLSLTFGLNVSF